MQLEVKDFQSPEPTNFPAGPSDHLPLSGGKLLAEMNEIEKSSGETDDISPSPKINSLNGVTERM